MSEHQQMNVRMPINDLRLIDEAVQNGVAMNRADFIRSAVREKAIELKKQAAEASKC